MLTEDFQKKIIHQLKVSEEEKQELKLLKNKGNGVLHASAVENTVEIPTIPETKMGLKFDAAAKELTLN